MFTKENLEKLLHKLNLYEFEIFEFDKNTNYIDLTLIIDYANELLDNENFEFIKYLTERCCYYYNEAIHTRLSFAPTIRTIFKSHDFTFFNNDDFEFGVKFSNDDLSLKEEKELEAKFIALTKAFLVRVLNEVL